MVVAKAVVGMVVEKAVVGMGAAKVVVDLGADLVAFRKCVSEENNGVVGSKIRPL